MAHGRVLSNIPLCPNVAHGRVLSIIPLCPNVAHGRVLSNIPLLAVSNFLQVLLQVQCPALAYRGLGGLPIPVHQIPRDVEARSVVSV